MKSADHHFELSNEAIHLRPFRLDDAEAIFEAVRESMRELGQWLSWCHPDYTIQDSIQFLTAQGETLRTNSEYGFAITDRANGRLLGACGINQFEKATRCANLGYWLRTSATQRGVATQAVRLVAHWTFAQLAIERIEIVAATGNHASQRVAERVGATREGIARGRLRVHGAQHDAVIFSLIRSDILAP
jgi:RimJ/RimL family protein N-acetyltransferase